MVDLLQVSTHFINSYLEMILWVDTIVTSKCLYIIIYANSRISIDFLNRSNYWLIFYKKKVMRFGSQVINIAPNIMPLFPKPTSYKRKLKISSLHPH